MNVFLFLILFLAPLSWAQVSPPENPPEALVKVNKIFLMTEINPINLQWSELGLEKEENFSEVLEASWMKWLSSQDKIPNREIVLCDSTCESEFKTWQETKINAQTKFSEIIQDGQWLKISFNLTKLLFVESSKEWHFEWDGRVILLDVNTKKVLSAHDLQKEKRVWRNLSQKDLNSKLASAIYRAPLDAFSKIIKTSGESLSFNRQAYLVIQGQKSVSEVFSLIELLKKEGKSIQLDVSLEGFGPKEAKLKCFYQGEEKSFTDVLSSLKELKSNHSYKLSVENTDGLHIIKLIAE